MKIDCLLHVHSSFSYDSKSDLADIARLARRHGVRCVLMSEHNNFMDASQMAGLVRRCGELSDDSLLIVPGLELAFDKNRVHLLAFGIREYIGSVAEGCTFRSLIEAIRAQDGLAVLAHPSHRGAAGTLDLQDLQALDGIEIWNVKNGNRFLPAAADLGLLARIRAADANTFGFAGVDWHHLNKFTRLVLTVDAPSLDRDVILARLKAGAFTVRGGWVTLPSTGEESRAKVRMYGMASGALSRARRMAYRWQSAIERKGFTTPKAITAAARRLF